MNEQDLKDVAYGMLSAMVNEKGMRKTIKWLLDVAKIDSEKLSRIGFEVNEYLQYMDDCDKSFHCEESTSRRTDDGEREYRSILNEQANEWNAEVNRR